jgi:uncharacterized repeat protein (TIGR02543 family)
MDADKTLYAGATISGGGGDDPEPDTTEAFHLSFNSNGGSRIPAETYTEPTEVDFYTAEHTPTRDGYTFTGWYTDFDLETRIEEGMQLVSEETTVVAGWEKEEEKEEPDGNNEPTEPVTTCYTLTYETNGGEDLAPEQFEENTVVDLTQRVPVRAGYTFAGWYTDAALTGDPVTAVTMTEDQTVYAQWNETTTVSTEITEPVTPEVPEPSVPKTAAPTAAKTVETATATPEELNSADHIAYVIGYTDGTVQPEASITRAEAATMLYRLLTEERRAALNTTQNVFSDVSADAWYAEAVNAMAQGGYINGYPDGSFRPNANITRAEFVAMVVRFLDEAETTGTFTDVQPGYWAYAAITRAAAAGWIDGYPDGTFGPTLEITRAEAMRILNRVLNRGVNENSELLDFRKWPDNADADAWYYYDVIEATNGHTYTGERPEEQWQSILETN